MELGPDEDTEEEAGNLVLLSAQVYKPQIQYVAHT